MARKSTTSELTYEQIQNIKAALWSVPRLAEPETRARMLPKGVREAAAARLAAPPLATLVAEGDSWFDYPPGLDILDQLKLRHGYEITKLSAAGDTLENMAFGTEIGRDFSRPTPQLNVLIETVSRLRPKVVLLSGGGNDIAGDELDSFLNHADSGLPKLRADYLKEVIHGLFRAAYERIARAIWDIDPSICIVAHGYGHAIPDGRAVLNFPFNFRFFGPWLRPAFTRKNITALNEARAIVKVMIDELNAMLSQLSASIGGPLHHLDLRNTIRASDWSNELHLTDEAYGRVADKFHAVIGKCLNGT